MAKRTAMHRTICTTPSRSRQIALAASLLEIDGEQFIQGAITAALVSLSHQSPLFALCLAREAGLSWAAISQLAETSIEGLPENESL
jgi:hypothetical protein